ncbi:MAG: thioesterase family protein [Planctomycetota bacterium]
MSADRVVEHHLRVRYAETDQMGVAHHGSYIPWIEEARTEWLRAAGRSYASMEREGLVLTVVSVSVRYRRPARYDDRIRITTRVLEVGGASLTFGYELDLVEREGEEAGYRIAEAETRLGLVDAAGRPRKLPPDLLGAAGPAAG